MAAALEILHLGSAHYVMLERLFSRIAADETARGFHPHPFTAVEARRITALTGRDLYFGLAQADKLVGYGMLRGWDEGYLVPRLGIYVVPELRRTGAARLLMQHMHAAARERGARSVQLTVHPDNGAALKLYTSLGYTFTATALPDGRLLGQLELDLLHEAAHGVAR